MQSARHYDRAPITEAILDLRVILPGETTIAMLNEIQSRVIDAYPSREQLTMSSFVLQPIGPTPIIGANQLNTGYLFRSEDGKQIFQATLNGFTFNRLRPYTSWDQFRSEARQLWEVYRDVCKPLRVIRAALRYINRLELPGPYLDFKDYLRTVPEIAPDLPQGLSGFFMQLQIPQEDLGCMLILTETMAPRTDPAIVPVILDFDLFREQEWPSDSEEIWEFLETLRLRKNELFEKSVTETAKELFD